ncbi:SPOR domain-containing protein [Rhodophyticola sp. CCM32]|uniref:SPOR domain-containing protein n=1 Tax=Rhodophyticola sp. CCM32 TaxID=2916397 RepID=UPI00107F042E|nr:SPOR domain-containing protein [Rhodophyticola sp. CCM32]QBX99879.1 SPOR domain-containing protein [Rhodophyticola sp. CCM32]
MADIDYFEEEAYASAPQPGPSRFGILANWMGALISLGLILGMIVWAWQLTMRDVTGVPVIRALEGAMRVAPETPGGSQADHQGLAVNRIAEGQEAEPAAERIVLAPPPVELAEIDLSSASLPEVTTEVAPEAPTPEAASEATLALIDRLMEGGEDTAPEAETGQADASAGTATEAGATPGRNAFVTIPISVPGVRNSPRPTSRPEGVQVAMLTTGTTDATPVIQVSAGAEIDPDSLTPGTRLVQLGAFDDEQTARAEWDRLSQGFPDFFVGRSRIVQPAISGGREFYRLRAHGFVDLSDARRFCTTLLAQGAACIPVTVR